MLDQIVFQTLVADDVGLGWKAVLGSDAAEFDVYPECGETPVFDFYYDSKEAILEFLKKSGKKAAEYSQRLDSASSTLQLFQFPSAAHAQIAFQLLRAVERQAVNKLDAALHGLEADNTETSIVSGDALLTQYLSQAAPVQATDVKKLAARTGR